MEQWVDLKDFPNYQISTHGNVLNKRTNHQLKPTSDRYGYLRLSLGNNDNVYIHRLMGDTFLTKTEDRNQINHIDGNRKNNHVLNLQWCTNSENIKWSIHKGTNAHLRASKQAQIVNRKSVKILETNMVFNSVKECADHIGVASTNISRCLKGIRKTVHNFHIEYV